MLDDAFDVPLPLGWIYKLLIESRDKKPPAKASGGADVKDARQRRHRLNHKARDNLPAGPHCLRLEPDRICFDLSREKDALWPLRKRCAVETITPSSEIVRRR